MKPEKISIIAKISSLILRFRFFLIAVVAGKHMIIMNATFRNLSAQVGPDQVAFCKNISLIEE